MNASLFSRHWGTPFTRALLFAAGMVLALTLGSRLLHVGERAALGEPAPAWVLEDPQGRPIRLEDFRGRPVLVNFWAVWCPPCREEMPLLDTLARQQDKVTVVAVDVGDSAEAVKNFLAQNGLRLPVALDAQGAVASRYQVQGLPTTFFLDARGIVRHIHVGALDESTLHQGLTTIGVTP